MAYNNRGIAYTDEDQPDKAIADCTEAIRLKPKYADAYYDRGRAYHKKGEYDTAILDYTEAIRLNPKLALVVFGAGPVATGGKARRPRRRRISRRPRNSATRENSSGRRPALGRKWPLDIVRQQHVYWGNDGQNLTPGNSSAMTATLGGAPALPQGDVGSAVGVSGVPGGRGKP